MIDFRWQVPTAGLECIEAEPLEATDRSSTDPELLVPQSMPGSHDPADRIYLVAVAPPPGQAQFRYYSPLGRPGLFRTFADTPTTPEGVLQFAQQFGFLGGRNLQGTTLLSKPRYFPFGEALKTWGAEIELMNEAVRLWEMCRGGLRDELSYHVFWQQNTLTFWGRSSRFWQPRFSVLLPMDGSTLVERDGAMLVNGGWPSDRPLDRDDIVAAGWLLLMRIVNLKLREHATAPQLSWKHGRDSRPSFNLVPRSLISALWVQLLQAVAGEKQYQQCQQCNRWYEVTAEKREGAKFCSNACRFKAYRQRQKDAGRLHAEGLSYQQIAAKLGSDVKTVRGWICQSRQFGGGRATARRLVDQ